MRIAHPSHRWNYKTQECRQCGCPSSGGTQALEVCPRAPAKAAPKASGAPSAESLNRAIVVAFDKRTP